MLGLGAWGFLFFHSTFIRTQATVRFSIFFASGCT
jgi:hypothetical protein